MQKMVDKFNSGKICHTKPMPAYARILDVQSEMGELAKEYLIGSKYGTKEFFTSEEFKMEYGDVLYSLLSLASELNLNAKDCLKMAIKKYENRIRNKNSMGSEN